MGTDMTQKKDDVIVPKEINEYMDNLEMEVNTKIDEDQRRWYFLKHKILQDTMKQEYPSTPKEAFESSNEGLYYGQQFAKLRADGRICRVPYNDYSLVHTSFDIGVDDYTSIWCFQLNPAGELQIIDFYENHDEGPLHYAQWLKSTKYNFGTHIMPHDAGNKSVQTNKTYADIMRPLIDGKIVVLTRDECGSPFNGIQVVRSILSKCVFDEQRCSKGIKHLENYKKEWDDRFGCYKNTPRHDEASHASDSFRYLAMGLGKVAGTTKISKDYEAAKAYFGEY